MPDDAQVIDRRRTRFIGALKRLHADFHRELGHLLAQIGQRVDELGHRVVGALFFDQRLDELAEGLEFGAVVAQHLAPEQIERLNGVGAFIDHVDAGIAHVLLHAPLTDVAVTAEYLQSQIGTGECVIGNEGLDHRSEQREVVVRGFALVFIGVRLGDVGLQRQPVGKAA